MVLTMTISPELHRLAHHDADDGEHSCIVTLILSGGTEVPLISLQADLFSHSFFSLGSFQSIRFPSFFLSGYVREHAPPSVS